MIVVTGLPRVGTMSTAKALEILGYDVLFYCPLTHQGTDWIETDPYKYDVIVDWSICSLLDLFVESIKVTKLIFLTRENGWELSLFNLNKLGGKKDYVSDYNAAVNFAINNKIPFISLDIVKNPRWNELCVFLNKPIPDISFPHLNKSDFNYTI